jgi:hypothetical protein
MCSSLSKIYNSKERKPQLLPCMCKSAPHAKYQSVFHNQKVDVYRCVQNRKCLHHVCIVNTFPCHALLRAMSVKPSILSVDKLYLSLTRIMFTLRSRQFLIAATISHLRHQTRQPITPVHSIMFNVVSHDNSSCLEWSDLPMPKHREYIEIENLC